MKQRKNSSNNDTKQTVPCLRIVEDHFGKDDTLQTGQSSGT